MTWNKVVLEGIKLIKKRPVAGVIVLVLIVGAAFAYDLARGKLPLSKNAQTITGNHNNPVNGDNKQAVKGDKNQVVQTNNGTMSQTNQ